MGNTKRIDGLKLVATDVDWSYDEGAEVRGTAEALLMAASGRAVALSDRDEVTRAAAVCSADPGPGLRDVWPDRGLAPLSYG